jgi:hypothetical protein
MGRDIGHSQDIQAIKFLGLFCVFLLGLLVTVVAGVMLTLGLYACYDRDTLGAHVLELFGKQAIQMFLVTGWLLICGSWLTLFVARKAIRTYLTALHESRVLRQNRTAEERRRRALGQMVMAAILPISACLIFYGGRYAEQRAQDAAGWPSTIGRVVTSEVRSVKSGRRGIRSKFAFVEYEFAVNGRQFRGDSRRILPAIQTSDASAEEIAARYRAGAAVDVFYDPNNPRDAVLDNTVDDIAMQYINQYVYLCLTIVAVAIALFLLGIRGYIRANHMAGSLLSKEPLGCVPQTSDDEDLDNAVQNALRRYCPRQGSEDSSDMSTSPAWTR